MVKHIHLIINYKYNRSILLYECNIAIQVYLGTCYIFTKKANHQVIMFFC